MLVPEDGQAKTLDISLLQKHRRLGQAERKTKLDSQFIGRQSQAYHEDTQKPHKLPGVGARKGESNSSE